ncbi:hypothetical protein [Yinghuangia soli]|uniref:Glycosyltransferase RgtA/B/C/D-like domain-containing protein n=1 Tax=Yinghuangia soli TaxID=2908204 RepID=A0AA41U932_9ACTN|nr:hypothetical protein [Yinghuangia soli]MCF2533489.1 hypothetical protein [Yinghuangia soli]
MTPATAGACTAATAVVLAAALLGTAALGARRASDAATVALSLFLLELTWLVKLLLLAGVFRPAGAMGGALLLLAATAGAVLAGRGSRRRIAALWRAVRQRLRGAPRRSFAGRRPSPFMLPAVVLAALAVLVHARSLAVALRLPPRDIDSLWYHLVAVAAWVRTGELAPAIENLSKDGDLGWTVAAETYPRDAETVSAWLSVFTHDTSLAGLTQFPFLLLMAAAVFGICRRLRAGRGPAVCAAALAVLAPTVVSQAYMAYNDIARAGVALAVWHVLLMAYPEADDRARTLPPRTALVLAGALLGLGIGIKAATVYLLPAAIVSGLVLRRAADPATRPGKAAGLAGLVLPAAAVGAFWYVRTWIGWGSPLWPVAFGPFDGPRTMDELVESARPPAWQGEPAALVVLRSWWSAVGRTGDAHWYVEWTGQLGLVWLAVLLPAALLLLGAALLGRPAGDRGRYRRAAFGVVLPVAAATLAAPGAWYSRYTMPLLGAGAVALAVLAGRTVARLPARRGRAAVLAVTPLVAAAVCAGLAGQFRYSTFRPMEDPGQAGFRASVRLLAAPAGERALEGVWGPYRGVDRLAAGTRIGFCAEDTPQYWIPLVLIGREYRRILVDLGSCTTASRIPALMRAADVTHLWTSRDSDIAERVRSTSAYTGLRDMRIAEFRSEYGWQLQLYTLAGPVRR